MGRFSLDGNTYGQDNTGVGFQSLSSNTTGSCNTATGDGSLQISTTGHDDTANGFYSLASNTAGSQNTAVGASSLAYNTTADNNTGVGFGSLVLNETGYDNTAVGYKAGGRNDTITGYDGQTQIKFWPTETGSWNTFLGEGTGAIAPDIYNCTAVGVDAYCDAANEVRFGNMWVTSIGGKVGWTALSDIRAKENVRDLDLGLDFVLQLRPVAYTLKQGNGKIDMGFVAQDIEALLGDGYNLLDIGGDPERTLSLRHTDLIAPLVKAVQEQQAAIAAKDARIAELENRQTAQQAKLEAQQDEIRAQRDFIADLATRLVALERTRQ